MGEGLVIGVGAALAVDAVGEVLEPLELLTCSSCLQSTRDELDLVSAVDQGVLDTLLGSLQFLDLFHCGAVMGTVSPDPPVSKAVGGLHEEAKVRLSGET